MLSIDTVNKKVNTGLVTLSSYMLLMALLVTVALVITRYFLGFSFSWAEEYTKYSVVYLNLLAAAAIARKREHIAVTYFIDKLPRKLKKLLNILYTLLCIAVMVIWIVVGFRAASFMKLVYSGGIGFSMMWPYLAIPISGIFFFFSLVLNLYEEFVPKKAPENP